METKKCLEEADERLQALTFGLHCWFMETRQDAQRIAAQYVIPEWVDE